MVAIRPTSRCRLSRQRKTTVNHPDFLDRIIAQHKAAREAQQQHLDHQQERGVTLADVAVLMAFAFVAGFWIGHM